MLNKKSISHLKKILLLVAVFWGQQSIAASCSAVVNSNWSASGNLTYQRDQAIGTWGSNKFGTTVPYAFSCTADTNADRDAYLSLTVSAAPVPGYTDVYPTNLPGVGVRYNYAINTGQSSFCPVNFDDHIINSVRKYTCHFYAGSTANMSFGSSIEFVKLVSSVSSGVITTIPSVTVSYSLNHESSTWNLPVMWNGSTNVILTAVACSMTTDSIQVPLDDVYADSLTSVGSIAKPKTFSVGLSCDPNAKVNVMMTGTQNADSSTNGVLQLNDAGSAGVASGVGIQILYNNAPLALNNNIGLKTSAGGVESFPFTAQYYQTKNQVTVGAVNAITTLNFTYQ